MEPRDPHQEAKATATKAVISMTVVSPGTTVLQLRSREYPTISIGPLALLFRSGGQRSLKAFQFSSINEKFAINATETNRLREALFIIRTAVFTTLALI